jgi:uncharacterized protein (TIGR03083 family)
MNGTTIARRPALERTVAMRLAATEYERCLAQLRSLGADEWHRATDCPAWDVRQMAAHSLGMVEMAASIREGSRQRREATKRGGVFIDALTDLQVRERADWSPERIAERFAARGSKAAAGRRRTPGLVRRRPMPVPQHVNGDDELWTLGYLLDVILTRDPWMHRADIARATGRDMHLTPDHDALLVADVVAEWAERHGRPFDLHLTGPAGGTWSVGAGGPAYELDAVDFCRAVTRRPTSTTLNALMGTEVPF